jgi:hypothetical protein
MAAVGHQETKTEATTRGRRRSPLTPIPAVIGMYAGYRKATILGAIGQRLERVLPRLLGSDRNFRDRLQRKNLLAEVHALTTCGEECGARGLP